jgi:hypothetical protein
MHDLTILPFQNGANMGWQLGLFAGTTVSEDQLNACLSPLYPSLWRMVKEPFDDLIERRKIDHAFRILNSGECAQWLRPQIVAKAHDLFDLRDEITIKTVQNQLYLKYRDEILIVPKKFRKHWQHTGLTFSSYDTRRNNEFWRQREVEGVENLPRIIVGYRFINEMTDCKIFVGLPRGKSVRLCYAMPDQSAIVAVSQPAIVAEATADVAKDYEVIAKKPQQAKTPQ